MPVRKAARPLTTTRVAPESIAISMVRPGELAPVEMPRASAHFVTTASYCSTTDVGGNTSLPLNLILTFTYR